MSKKKELHQDFLPGTAPVKNKKVHPKALRYVEMRDTRIAANKEEADAHDNLLHAMLEEGLEVYEYGDLRVDISNSKKCKVKVEPKASPEANGEAVDTAEA